MTAPVTIRFRAVDLDSIAGHEGRLVVFAEPGAGLDRTARRVNRLTRGALERLIRSDEFAALDPGASRDMAWPTGMAADVIQVVRLARRPTPADARCAGAHIGAAMDRRDVLVLAGTNSRAAEISKGLALRSYSFDAHKSDPAKPRGAVTFMVSRPEAVAADARDMAALAEGVFFARDLVNEPANILTTDDFAARLAAMQELGLEVEILDEPALEKLGMRVLLAVGRASTSPTKVVVMRWRGGAPDEAPLALVGKGVTFDSGGVSIKPAAGMEEMTMDMGGAAVVAGAMRALALRRARANVVGVVGLVENMISGDAQRPGDVVRSMKGDTIEVVNTDAEGRLLLADVLWYTQEEFRPAAMIDFATLTGAMVVALGHENAGVFANDDALCAALLDAAQAEDEGAWRLPLSSAYDPQLKSRIADVKNTGGRPAGSITAARFLQRFVPDDMPWCHVDIAGVALRKQDSRFAPKGATGWGVRMLDRLVRARFEG